jgi:hypothetical protein
MPMCIARFASFSADRVAPRPPTRRGQGPGIHHTHRRWVRRAGTAAVLQHDDARRLAIEDRLQRPASPRMTGASAEEEIDEPTGKFLRPCSDITCFQWLTYLSRAIVRQSAKFDRGGDGQPAEPARVSGLSERHRSHWVPIRKVTSCLINLTIEI